MVAIFSVQLAEFYGSTPWNRISLSNSHYQVYFITRNQKLTLTHISQTTASLVSYFQKYVIADAATASSPPLLVTIFLGANDACFKYPSFDNIVPLNEYVAHLRNYVQSILSSEATKGTRVVLITPPPIDVSSSVSDVANIEEDDLKILRDYASSGRGYKTWVEKRRYAKAVVELGKEMKMQSDRVSWLDLWSKLTEARCKELSKEMENLEKEEILPGSGMPGAEEFGRDWFLDGLHFGPKVSIEQTLALMFANFMCRHTRF